MHKGAIVAVSALTMVLAACGSDPAPDPVNQIVVREPGEAAKPKGLPSREPGAPPFPAAVGEQAFATCSGCHVSDPFGALLLENICHESHIADISPIYRHSSLAILL